MLIVYRHEEHVELWPILNCTPVAFHLRVLVDSIYSKIRDIIRQRLCDVLWIELPPDPYNYRKQMGLDGRKVSHLAPSDCRTGDSGC